MDGGLTRALWLAINFICIKKLCGAGSSSMIQFLISIHLVEEALYMSEYLCICLIRKDVLVF